MQTGKTVLWLVFPFLMSSLCVAQSHPPKPFSNSNVIPLTVKPGVPIRVALEKSVRVKHAGVPVEGRVIQPVYVFNRKVIPVGSILLGKVTKIDPVSKKKRLEALANGDLTPFHQAHIEFSTLVLKDGKRVPIQTAVSPGTSSVVHLVAGGKGKKDGRVKGKIAELRREIKSGKNEAIKEIKSPHKLKQLEALLTAQLPFHRQFLTAGTQFTATLREPLNLGKEKLSANAMKKVGSRIPPGSIVHVWLATPLSSAKDHRGTPVEAIVSQPLFSRNHKLILPEGSRLEGKVVRAKPARRLNRNGTLRFAFHRIKLPRGATRRVEAVLHGATVAKASHMKIGVEGGAHAASSRKKYIMPAIDVLLATTAFDTDSQTRAVQEGSAGGSDPASGVIRGGFGFGLLGSVVALAARLQPVTAAFAFYGAAMSVYSHVLARGSQVVFPKDTTMEISFGTHEGPLVHPRKKATPSQTKSIARSTT